MGRAILIGSAIVFAVLWGAAPAAPQTPQAGGAPFVKSVGYYQDWQLTQPIHTTVEPGTTLYTKIVFSEPMKLKVAADQTARPILYYRVGNRNIRYRMAKHGAGGADFVSGDAKPLRGGTDDYICKYTIPEGTTGEFRALVGKLSADLSGNTMENFYTHSVRLTIGKRAVAPGVGTGGTAPNPPQPTVEPETLPELQVVYMPDPNLRKAVVAKINEQAALPSERREVPEAAFTWSGEPKKPSDPIYAPEMRLIRTLTAEAVGIESLIGLEYATHLQSLRLGNILYEDWDISWIQQEGQPTKYKATQPTAPNRISDLTPLRDLTNLKVLTLACNAVENLTPLIKLTNLTVLSLTENKITDLQPLANLTNLQQLYIDNYYYSPLWAGDNHITDLTPLQNLRNLWRLDVHRNPIGASIGVVRNFPKLNGLGIGCCGVSNLRPLLEAPGLRGAQSWVYLTHSPITEADVPDLDALRARGVRVEDGIFWRVQRDDGSIALEAYHGQGRILGFGTNNVERCSVSHRESFRAAPALQLTTQPNVLSSLWHDLSQVPEKTALLPNYPNPFNPETWIPYQLATPAEVTVAIHAADGRFVRTVAVGYQPAGVYQSKARAAYWDGRNAHGETVASGLYFYTLTAGDFTQTQKMLIRK